jgi:hypothetical protein
VGVGVGAVFGVGEGIGVDELKRVAGLEAHPAIANRQATRTRKKNTPRMFASFAIGFSCYYPHPRASGFLHRLGSEAIHLRSMSSHPLDRSLLNLLD